MGEFSAAAAGVVNVDGIEIQTDDVALDLNGFALVGPGAATATGEGIQVTGSFQGILIRNGVVRDCGNRGTPYLFPVFEIGPVIGGHHTYFPVFEIGPALDEK